MYFLPHLRSQWPADIDWCIDAQVPFCWLVNTCWPLSAVKVKGWGHWSRVKHFMTSDLSKCINVKHSHQFIAACNIIMETLEWTEIDVNPNNGDNNLFIFSFIYLFVIWCPHSLTPSLFSLRRATYCAAPAFYSGGCYPPLLCNDIHELGPPYGRASVVCVSCYGSSQRLLGAIWLRPNDRGRANSPRRSRAGAALAAL